MEGHRDYKMGFGLSQNEYVDTALKILKGVLVEEDNYPKTIIELGTYKGGFAFLLKDTFQASSVYTFDIGGNCDVERLERAANVKANVSDLFSEETTQLIISLIQKPGQTVLFCDNGDKKREFNLFSAYLKSGDVILAHDYAPDGQYFSDHMHGKIWNWKEIEDSDINDACKAHNLQDFLREEFIKAAWVCKRKV